MGRMAPDHLAFGRACEDLAAEHLSREGYRIVTRNFRARGGEIDIIAGEGGTLVFVEVKGKHSERLGYPEEMVDRRKIGRIVGAALAWMEGDGWKGRGCRFDVIAVLAGPGGPPKLEHIKGAFNLDDA